MRVKVTSDKFNLHSMHGGKFQRLPVGAEFDIDAIPKHWVGLVEPVSERSEEPKQMVVNPDMDEMLADYRELAGKDADGRWGPVKLREELEKLANG